MRTSDNRVERAKQVDLRQVISLEDRHEGRGYIHGYCPFHEADGQVHKTRSFLVYPDHYLCLSARCGEHGDIFNWYAYQMFGDTQATRGRQFKAILERISSEPIIRSEPPLRPKTPPSRAPQEVDLGHLARIYHRTLLEEPERLQYFLDRGFARKTIESELWGWDGKHYVITVWEGVPRKSSLLALRLRSSKKDTTSKYSGITGYNQPMLYNRQALLQAVEQSKPIFIFYGEFDARLAFQDGLCAVSPTNGALSFESEWLDGHTGEKIFVPDIGEERAAYQDAGVFGSRGWVLQFPPGPFKDYTEFRHFRSARALLKELPVPLRKQLDLL